MIEQRLQPLGLTRTATHRNHAFIGPDSHVPATPPGWTDTKGVILISPRMGARFIQYIADLQGGSSKPPAPGVQRFLYVMEGTALVEAAGKSATLEPTHYAYIPADTPHSVRANGSAVLMVFEKHYHKLPGVDAPPPVFGRAADIPGNPFLGDPDATLQLLLPDVPAFDMAVNIFTYKPGAALPYVEVHIMEHGLTMIAGAGVYRLDDQWYPTQKGDTIWMGPYCPQWFCAYGKESAAYIYYKDINRDAMLPEELP